MNIDLDDDYDDPFAKSLPIPSQTTTRNRENSIDLVAVQELREDVKVKSMIEEQNDLTNDTGDARCATPIRSLEQGENTPKQRPADPGDRRNFDKWRQALSQTLDDYGWSVNYFYEDTQLKRLFDCISEETELTGHKSDRKGMKFYVNESKCCLKAHRRKLIKP